MPRAVVLTEIGAPMRVAEIELPDPGPGQVRVRLAAAGVCHSDLSLSNGTLRQPVPAVLGHEGAGTVVAVGDGVTGVAPGDRVVLNWSPSCGECQFCARRRGRTVRPRRRRRRHALRESRRPQTPTVRRARHRRVRRGDGRPRRRRAAAAGRRAAPDAALLGCAVLTGVRRGAPRRRRPARASPSSCSASAASASPSLQSARIAGAGADHRGRRSAGEGGAGPPARRDGLPGRRSADDRRHRHAKPAP